MINKKIKKTASIFLCTFIIISTLAFHKTTINAAGINGWVQKGTTWYYYVNGVKTVNWNLVGGEWYYFNSNGVMQTGWILSGGKWYYLKSSGDMATNWILVNGRWYYLKSGGDMAAGWIIYNGKWYYLNANGDMATGWIKYSGTWYYLYIDGSMAVNTIIDGWKLDNTGAGTIALSSNILGNSIGNNNNKGMFVLNNDWLYTNTIDSDYIFKMKIDGSQKKMLNLQPTAYLNSVDNYIFYINIQDNSRVYRMNTDGSDVKCVNSTDWARNLIVYNNYIYYSNVNDKGRIYRMRFDGSGKTKITDDVSCQYINFDGSYIYYTTGALEEGAGYLYRADLDGTNKKLISENKAAYEIIDNGVIYFINGDGNLCRINADGTDYRKLNDDNCSYLNIYNDVLYYTNKNDNWKLYATKTDGTLRTPVTSDAAYYTNIINDRIYYRTGRDYSDTHSVSTVKLDNNETPVDSTIIGNIPGNINNQAFAASDGQNIYVTEYDVYRYNNDYTNKLFIGSDARELINYINVSNGWIYYASMSTNVNYGNERIYKIKADGSGQKIELSTNKAFYMTVAGDWIYYTTEESDYNFMGAGPIHKVKIDGTGETYVDAKNFDYAVYLNVVGDYIYYVNSKDNMNIYRVKTDGTGREKVISEPARGLNVVGGYIYYCTDYYGDLKRMPINGDTAVTIQNNLFENFIVTSDKIYYVRFSAVYSSNLDGSSETLITNCSLASKINVAGNYLYYMDDKGTTNVKKIY